MKNCPQCGAPIGVDDVVCKYCGEKLEAVDKKQPQQVIVDRQQPQEIVVNITQQDTKSQNAPNKPITNSGSAPQQPMIHLSNHYEFNAKKKNTKIGTIISAAIVLIILIYIMILSLR